MQSKELRRSQIKRSVNLTVIGVDKLVIPVTDTSTVNTLISYDLVY